LFEFLPLHFAPWPRRRIASSTMTRSSICQARRMRGGLLHFHSPDDRAPDAVARVNVLERAGAEGRLQTSGAGRAMVASSAR
jgi:hypothetical protein